MKKVVAAALLAIAIFAILFTGRAALKKEEEGYAVPSVFVKEIQHAKNRI